MLSFRSFGRVLLTIFIAHLLIPLTVSAAPAAQAGDVTCRGQAATIVYVGYDVAIYGTDGNDVIVVDGGWNRIHGGGGADLICVAGHFNLLEGGDGADTITVSGLHNTLSGGDGDDLLDCDDVRNELQGGPGMDQCNGEACQ
jgi:Ca2+-binding RTX toxin-like protein